MPYVPLSIKFIFWSHLAHPVVTFWTVFLLTPGQARFHCNKKYNSPLHGLHLRRVTMHSIHFHWPTAITISFHRPYCFHRWMRAEMIFHSPRCQSSAFTLVRGSRKGEWSSRERPLWGRDDPGGVTPRGYQMNSWGRPVGLFTVDQQARAETVTWSVSLDQCRNRLSLKHDNATCRSIAHRRLQVEVIDPVSNRQTRERSFNWWQQQCRVSIIRAAT